MGDPVATSIMLEGLRLDFVGERPPLHMSCPVHLITSGIQEDIILSFIPGWLDSGYVKEIFFPTPLHFSRMFTVPKGTSERRPILDLSPLNLLLKRRSFRMEDLMKVAKCVFPGLWAVKLDLKDAYYNILLSALDSKFLAFALGNRIFTFLVLPFGLSTAPWAFTRVMKPIKKKLRRLGILISSFLDDFLILASSYKEAVEHTAIVIDLLQRLGLEINWGKSSLVPMRRLEYLGVIVDLENMTFGLPEEKILKVLSLVNSVERPSLLRSELESLIGFISFAANYLPLGRLLLKPIQKWVNTHSSPLFRNQQVLVDEGLREALRPWANKFFLHSKVPIRPRQPSLSLMTDASDKGWAGILLPYQVVGEWTLSQQRNSINWKELKAIHFSLQHFLPLLKGKCISIRADNRSALSCIRRQGTLASDLLCLFQRRFWSFLWHTKSR